MLKFKLNQIVVAILAIILVGCVPAAFIAGAGASGAIVYDKRNMVTMVEDRDMTNAVLKVIGDNPRLRDNTNITVASFNHVLLLAGQATTDDLRTQVYNIANALPKVKRVYNQITVEPPLDKKQIANDMWITTKVKSMILAEPGLNSSQIKVVTDHGVVYLMGVLTHKQSDIAADVASHVSGVQQVVKIFEYEQ